jgi:hypothetical protein
VRFAPACFGATTRKGSLVQRALGGANPRTSKFRTFACGRGDGRVTFSHEGGL